MWAIWGVFFSGKRVTWRIHDDTSVHRLHCLQEEKGCNQNKLTCFTWPMFIFFFSWRKKRKKKRISDLANGKSSRTWIKKSCVSTCPNLCLAFWLSTRGISVKYLIYLLSGKLSELIIYFELLRFWFMEKKRLGFPQTVQLGKYRISRHCQSLGGVGKKKKFKKKEKRKVKFIKRKK